MSVLLFTLFGAATLAQADQYAYSLDQVSGLSFSNSTAQLQQSLLDNQASVEGFGRDEHINPVDPLQAKSGPGSFPDENYFQSWGKTHGQYARADSLLKNFDIGNITGYNVAEVFSQSEAYADARVYLDFALTVKDLAQPITMSMSAFPIMLASTDLGYESSQAQLAFTITLRDPHTDRILFQWTPNGTKKDFVLNQGTVTDVVDPFSLNTSISCSGECRKSYQFVERNQFSIRYRNPAVKTYDVTVSWDEFAKAESPEPSSLLLLASGMVGLMRSLGRQRSR
jgi:hypothetical protein